MSDDIDIEEHDLLQHPTLRSVFPDLARIKIEVEEHTDEEEIESNIYEDLEVYSEKQEQSPSRQPNYGDINQNEEHIKLAPHSQTSHAGMCDNFVKLSQNVTENSFTSLSEISDKHNDFRKTSNSVIDVGELVDIAVKEENCGNDRDLIDAWKDEFEDLTGTVKIENTESEIIGTSKEIKDTVDGRRCIVEKRCFQAYVSVHDCLPLLVKRNCFCVQCRTMFDSDNVNTNHDVNNGGLLSLYQLGSHLENCINVCSQCPDELVQSYKPSQRMFQKPNSKQIGPVKKRQAMVKKMYKSRVVEAMTTEYSVSGNVCQICELACVSKEDLIVHLYEHFGKKMITSTIHVTSPKSNLQPLLTPKASSVAYSEASSSGKSLFVKRKSAASAQSVNGFVHSSDSSLRSSVSTNLASAVHRNEKEECLICTEYLKHMVSVHRMQDIAEPEHARVKSVNVECRRCEKSFDRISKYTLHVKLNHTVYTCDRCQVEYTGARMIRAHRKKCRVNDHLVGNNKKTTFSNCPIQVQFQYRCLECGESFSNYKRGWNHRNKNHKDILGSLIVRNHQKIILKKTNVSSTVRMNRVESVAPASLAVSDRSPKASPQQLSLFQCERCKNHLMWSAGGIKIHRAKGDECEKMKCRPCKYCGLAFTKSSLKLHYRVHRRSVTPLAAWDFRVVTSDGSCLPFDRRAALDRLPRCTRCGVIYAIGTQPCGTQCLTDSKVYCRSCKEVFSKAAYAWHRILHKMKRKPTRDRSSKETVPGAAGKISGVQRKGQSDHKKGYMPQSSKSIEVRKSTSEPSRNYPTVLNTVFKCYDCDSCFTVYRNLRYHRRQRCSVNYSERCRRKCPDCGLYFLVRDLRQHLEQHRACKELQFLDETEYIRNRYRILHRCERCGVCGTSNHYLNHHTCGAAESVDCDECGLRIANRSMFLVHEEFHNRHRVSPEDFIVIRYGLVRHSNLNLPTLENETFKLIQCETCKNHLVQSGGTHRPPGCVNMKYSICGYCGLAFTPKSIVAHLRQHRRSATPLTARHFSVVDAGGRRVAYDLQAALRRLPRCKRCGVLFRRPRDVCRQRRCKDVAAVRCHICKCSFSDAAYEWHRVLH